MKKFVGVLVAVLVVLVLAGAFLLPRLLDINHYHDLIQSQLQKRLGRQVELGDMHLALFPPTFKVQNAVIGEDPNFISAKPFAHADELDIQVKLAPLLHKQVQVTSLRMVRPQVELIRGENGQWNFASMGKHEEQQPEAQSQSQPVQLDRFELDDGAIGYTDRQAHKPRVEYDHIDALVRDYAPGKPVKLAVNAHLPGGSRESVKLNVTAGPLVQAMPDSTPLEGTLQLNQVALSDARQYLDSKALAEMDAKISGNLQFKNDGGRISTSGTLNMDNVVAQGKQLGFPIVLEYGAIADLLSEVVHVNNSKLKIGNTPFEVNGTVDHKTDPAMANLRLTTENASITDLVKLAQALGVQISPGMDPSGQLTADLLARGPISGPAVSGTLRAANLQVSGVHANSVQVNLDMEPPGADVVKTLTGRVNLRLDDAKLTGVDMKQKLGEIGKFAGVAKTADGATHVSQLTGSFNIVNGVATTTNLKANTDAGTIAAVGSASLVDQGLNMKATAVLSKEDSKQVGGSGVGGLMTTALENKQGELVIPVLVSGTIPNPKVEPDMGAMANMKMHNLLPSFDNPAQLTQSLSKLGGGHTGDVLGGLTKSLPGAATGNQSGKSNSMQDTINGLGGLFGGKKK